jgi:hypothetical protein
LLQSNRFGDFAFPGSGETPKVEKHTFPHANRKFPFFRSGTARMKKGTPIKIVDGKYKGCWGWIDTSRDATACFVPVIVSIKKGSAVSEKKTRVAYESYVLITEIKQPTTYKEAVMSELSDIDALMRQLVKKLAECENIGAHGEAGKNVAGIFLDRLGKAIAAQNNKGEKARWRRVKWRQETGN